MQKMLLFIKEEQYLVEPFLSEAYVAYKLSNTELKVGRQYIATPLISGSGTRFMRESFQKGATLVNTDLPQTAIWAGWIDKVSRQNSAVEGYAPGNPGSFEDRVVLIGSNPGGSLLQQRHLMMRILFCGNQ